MSKSYSFEELTEIGRKQFNLDNDWNCFMAEVLEQTNYKYMLYGLSSGQKKIYGLVSLI